MSFQKPHEIENRRTEEDPETRDKFPAFEEMCQKSRIETTSHFIVIRNVHLEESDPAAQPVVEDEQLEKSFLGQVK